MSELLHFLIDAVEAEPDVMIRGTRILNLTRERSTYERFRSEFDAQNPSPWLTVISAVRIFNDQVLNGGIEQFLFNSVGRHAEKIPSAYREVGALKTAALIESFFNLFPRPIPEDQHERQRILARLGAKGIMSLLAEKGIKDPSAVFLKQGSGTDITPDFFKRFDREYMLLTNEYDKSAEENISHKIYSYLLTIQN